GGSAVLITQNGVKLRGYRKARKDDHRGADPASDPGTVSLQVAGAGESASTDVAPDLTEPIVAFRVWLRNFHDGGQLYSTIAGVGWTAREKMTAVCNAGSGADRHAAPDSECACGI